MESLLESSQATEIPSSLLQVPAEPAETPATAARKLRPSRAPKPANANFPHKSSIGKTPSPSGASERFSSKRTKARTQSFRTVNTKNSTDSVETTKTASSTGKSSTSFSAAFERTIHHRHCSCCRKFLRTVYYPIWFIQHRLTLRQKQCLFFFIGQLILVLLVLFQSLTLKNSLNSAWSSRSLSELSLSEITYNIKINQMGFGLQTQANSAILKATAREYYISQWVKELEQRMKIDDNQSPIVNMTASGSSINALLSQTSMPLFDSLNFTQLYSLYNNQYLDDVESTKTILSSESSTRKIEMAFIVSSREMEIFASPFAIQTLGNLSQNNYGNPLPVWNHRQLISNLFARGSSAAQVRTTTVLSNEEYLNYKAPLYRETASQFEPSASNHPLDNGAPALTRLVITPIFDDFPPLIVSWLLTNGTVRTFRSPSLLGALVGGDIVNGKTPISSRIVSAYRSGLHGVAFYDSRRGWIMGTSFLGVQSSSLSDSNSLLAAASPTLPGLDFNSLFDPLRGNSLFSEVSGPQLNLASTTYSLSARKLNIPTTDPAISPVAIRGTSENKKEAVYAAILQYTLIFCGTALAINVVTFLWQLRSYLQPLEELAQRLKYGGKIDDSSLEKIAQINTRTQTIHMIWTSVLTGLSFLLSIYFTYTLLVSELENWDSAASECRGLDVFFSIKQDQIAFGSLGNSRLPDVREFIDDYYQLNGPLGNFAGKFQSPVDLAANSSSFAQRNSIVTALLRSEVTRRQIEYAVLLIPGLNSSANSMDPIILASGNSALTRFGASFDPHGVVSQTFRLGVQGHFVRPLPYSQWLLDKPPVFRELLSVGTPVSSRHPNDTRSSSWIRWVATPVFSSDSDRANGISPVAVILCGDLINGKSAILQRAVDTYRSGYTALVAYSPASDSFETLNSIRMIDPNLPADQRYSVDEGINQDFLRSLIKQDVTNIAVLRSSTVDTELIEAGGIKYRGAAKLLVADLRSDGANFLPVSSMAITLENGGLNSPIYLFAIRGLEPESSTTSNDYLVFQIAGAISSMALTLLMNFAASRPLKRFITRLTKSGWKLRKTAAKKNQVENLAKEAAFGSEEAANESSISSALSSSRRNLSRSELSDQESSASDGQEKKPRSLLPRVNSLGADKTPSAKGTTINEIMQKETNGGNQTGNLIKNRNSFSAYEVKPEGGETLIIATTGPSEPPAPVVINIENPPDSQALFGSLNQENIKSEES